MPPKIDLSALPPLDKIKGASIGSLNKTQLLTLALALEITIPGLPKDIMVKDLKPQVLEALKTPRFATDPRFLKFSAHRPATTGAAVKNSADKSAQDAQAAVQDSKAAPTGDYRTLMEGKVEADPPPKFKVLSNGEHKGGAAEPSGNKDDESSLSSLDSDAAKPFSQAPVSSPARKPNSSPAHKVKDEVLDTIKFSGFQAREVYILPHFRKQITVEKGPNGAYFSSLKKIIPAALAEFSSLRNAGNAKLTVTGITGNPLSLGSAGDFSKGNIPAVLQLREADTCLLRQDMTALGPVLVLDVQCTSQVRASVKFESSKITGDIKPLDLARVRSPTLKKSKKFKAEDDEDDEVGFYQFLNSELRGSVPDYALGVVLKTVGQMLVRYNDLKRAISICDAGWVRKEKGRGAAYCVPARYAEHANTNYHQYASRRFNKTDIEDALDIGKSVASGDRGLFQHPDLPFVDDAQKWVDGDLVGGDEDRAIKSAFDKMAPKEWKNYLETSKKQGDKQREKEAKRTKDEKRKRQADEAEAKDAKKRQRRHKSESVDTDAGSEEDEEIILQRRLQEIQRKKQRAAPIASNESGSDGAQAGPSRRGGRSRKSSLHLDTESDSAHT